MVTISVIVPCLVRDDAAERCLAEISRQAESGGAALDLVVVEGVSPCGRARNEGLVRAIGDYVAWVDADDRLAPDWWKSLVGALASRPDAVVFGWRNEGWGRDFPPRLGCAPTGETLLRAVICDEPGGTGSYLWNKILRRALWDGLRFDETLRVLEDYALMPTLLGRVRTVVALDRILYVYAANAVSVLHRTSPAQEREVVRIAARRVDDWRATPYRREAAAAFVEMAHAWFERQLLAGDTDPSARQEGCEMREMLRARLRDIVFARCPVRIRVKALADALGWWWVQRLAWRLHGIVVPPV